MSNISCGLIYPQYLSITIPIACAEDYEARPKITPIIVIIGV